MLTLSMMTFNTLMFDGKRYEGDLVLVSCLLLIIMCNICLYFSGNNDLWMGQEGRLLKINAYLI